MLLLFGDLPSVKVSSTFSISHVSYIASLGFYLANGQAEGQGPRASCCFLYRPSSGRKDSFKREVVGLPVL